ncbi:MAG TPA: glycosyltransferase family 4 protein [Acidiferrobacter sp.]|nr:glycosyltransferase family 4 protein [Acidiferrobacter sp.]
MTHKKIAIAARSFVKGGGMERYVLDITSAMGALGIVPVLYTAKIDSSLPEARLVQPIVFDTRLVPGKLKARYLSFRIRPLHQRDPARILIGCFRNSCSDMAICGGTHIGFLRNTLKRPSLFDTLETRLEREFYGHSRLVIAHSRFMEHELKTDYQVPQTKIRVLYPPVSPQFGRGSGDKAEARRALGLPNNEILFLFASTSHKRKGFDLLQKFFSQTRLPIRLLVAGRPTGGSDSKITYLGYRADMGNVYRAADFTIHPSLYEPFGLVCVESLVCGTPIIVSDRVGASETVADAAKVVMDTLDYDGLTSAIGQALDRRESLADAARSTPLSYNTDMVFHVQEMMRLYDSLD